MGIFSKFENKMEDTFDSIGDKMFDAPISPVQIAKKAEKQMRRGKMVGAGKQYAPTLYTVLVNPEDDKRLSGYYPTLAGETETYLKAKANEAGLAMDGQPLVRFFTDADLKSGKFDVIAEAVAGAIVEQLRVEEISNYGLNQNPAQSSMGGNGQPQSANDYGQDRPNSSANLQSQPNSEPNSHGFDAFAPATTNESFQAKGMGSFQQVEEDNTPQDQLEPQPYQGSDAGVNPAQYQQPVEQNADQVSYGHDGENQSAYGQGNNQPAYNQPAYDDPAVAQQPEADNAVYGQPQGQGQVQPEPQNPASQQFSASSPTMVFAGGAPMNAENKIPVNQVPPAHLRDNATGKIYTLNAATIVIGRENTCGVVIPDANASRQHAQIIFTSGVWMLNDLGSTNGTFINNQEITTRQLNSGDIITIGITNLQFNIG